MLSIGVDTFIWTEDFSEKDLWIIQKAKALGFSHLDIAIAHPEKFPTKKVKAIATEVQIPLVTTTTLSKETNLISSDPKVRSKGIDFLKRLIDINNELGSKILGGVNYAGWGCLTGKPRTEKEWRWSVEAMREVAAYSRSTVKW